MGKKKKGLSCFGKVLALLYWPYYLLLMLGALAGGLAAGVVVSIFNSFKMYFKALKRGISKTN